MDTTVATPAPAAAPEAPQETVETPTETPEGGEQPKPKTEAQKAEERRRYKVKIDKEELEVDEDELIAGYQSRKASQKAWQAASEKEKQILSLFKKIKDNPRKGLQELTSHPALGIDLRKIATEMLADEIERERMTPEQREAADMRAELEKYRAEKEEAERSRMDAETAALRRQYAEQVEKEIVEAIKPSGLPVTKFTFKKVAFYLKEGLARGYKLTAADVVPLVRQDYEQEQKALFSNLDDEALEKMLGEEIAEKLSKRRIAKLKGQVNPPEAPKGAAETPAEPAKPRAPRKDPAVKETFAQVANRLAGRK